MKLSSHEEYGMRCLIRLAQDGKDGKTIPEISLAEGISEAYAGKLLRMLRLGGFVTAARGVGGYSLARPARQIIVRDVMAALGGSLFEVNFCETHCGQMDVCVRFEDCSLKVLWHAVQTAVDDVLRKTTLEDLFRNEQQMFTWIQGFRETRGFREIRGVGEIQGFGELAPPVSRDPISQSPMSQDLISQSPISQSKEPSVPPLRAASGFQFTPFCCVH